MEILVIVLTGIFVIVCILLIAIILLQPHYSESGLAGAFGGGGGMDSFLGVKAVSVAAKITVALAVLFLLLAIVLAQLPRTAGGRGLISSEKTSPPPPAKTVTPPPAQEVSPVSPTESPSVIIPDVPITISPTETITSTQPVSPTTPIETPREEPSAPISPEGR
ncbi:MAG: preprotein translocase subunit SecG [Planctomycetota bacterium]|nr:preprotein translocase subunit SecG [Planctomycetota bacterium]